MPYGKSKSSYATPVYLIGVDGEEVNLTAALTGGNTGGGTAASDLDTDGNAVPTYKSHTFTYNDSGNLVTDTVSDGTNTWVRTLTYVNGVQSADSGWVKQ